MVPQTQVPFDIVDSILQNLCDDKAMLKTASLVSHSFLASSQRYLFSKISLWINYYTDDSYTKPNQLLSIFMAKPELALYIKTFRLSTTGESDQSFTELTRQTSADSSIISLCEQLSNIRSLTLLTRWDFLTLKTQCAILKLCNSPYLQHIDATGLHGFPMTYFLQMSHITRITLRGVQRSYPTAQKIPTTMVGRDGQSQARGFLEILEFDESTFQSTTLERLSSLLIPPKTGLDISNLRFLKLNGNSSELMEEAWKIIQLATKTLEYFVWDLLSHKWGRPYYNNSFPFGIIDISHMPNLRVLAFATDASQPNDSWILDSITHLPVQNRLENLMVAIYHDPLRVSSIDIEGFLTPLDEYLVLADYPHLKSVSIYLGVTDNQSFSSTRSKDTWITKAAVINGMPSLRRAGILEVENIDPLHRNYGPFSVDNILATLAQQ